MENGDKFSRGSTCDKCRVGESERRGKHSSGNRVAVVHTQTIREQVISHEGIPDGP